jgi:hypothetical protein
VPGLEVIDTPTYAARPSDRNPVHRAGTAHTERGLEMGTVRMRLRRLDHPGAVRKTVQTAQPPRGFQIAAQQDRGCVKA